MPRPDSCDWADVQGLVRTGYGRLRHARYLLFRVNQPAAAKAFVRSLLSDVTNGRDKPGDAALNIAFSHNGLRVLSGSLDDLSSFPRAFIEGMAGSCHRSRVLGDLGDSAPERWFWGGPNRAVDGLLILYHCDSHELTTWVNQLRSEQASGLTWLIEVATERTEDDSEAFGFRDGISQPLIADSHTAREHPNSKHVVPLGEILLGYEDNAGVEPPLPGLPSDPEFGVNGTYLVARQLAQDVTGFWNYMDRNAPCLGMTGEALAARVVGRTRNGDLLLPGGDARSYTLTNDFGFGNDRDGSGCPLGSHVRRGNPRDMLTDNADASWKIVNRHRLLRRGRKLVAKEYGDPGAPTNQFNGPGLMFVALNADIERQFEFVQQNWINDPGFAELAHERDPLVGVREIDRPNTFTITRTPVRRRIDGLQDFVKVQGGEYFFLPGLRSLGRLVRH